MGMEFFAFALEVVLLCAVHYMFGVFDLRVMEVVVIFTI